MYFMNPRFSSNLNLLILWISIYSQGHNILSFITLMLMVMTSQFVEVENAMQEEDEIELPTYPFESEFQVKTLGQW